MKLKNRRLLTVIFTLAFCLSAFLGQVSSHAQNGGNGVVEAVSAFERVTGSVDASAIRRQNFNSSVIEAKDGSEIKTVIIRLSGKTLMEGVSGNGGYLSTAEGRAQIRAVENEQNALLKRLRSHGISYSYVDGFDTVVNAVAVKTSVKSISAIKSIAGVEGVYVSERYAYPEAVESYSSDGGDSLAGAATVNKTNVYDTGIYDSSEIISKFGYSGAGTVVAVLDTGLDYTHDAFQTLPPSSTLALTRADVEAAVAKTGSAQLSAVKRGLGLGKSFTANDFYVSDKVPFAFDYADDDADVYPSYSSHGVHVAGIIAGQDDGYTDKDGNQINEPFIGVAPDAQLVICKTFTDDLESENLGGAVTEDLIAALDDCVKLGVDVINMSLGTSGGFSDESDADPEGALLNDVYSSIREAGISLICAASNDFSAGYGSAFGTNLASNPDSSTVGSPSTYAAAMSVASINGKKSDYLLANEGVSGHETAVFFEESSDENSVPYDFAKALNEKYPEANGVFEYVLVKGVGKAAEYTKKVENLLKDDTKPRLVLVQRGDNTFKEKVEIAMEMGAEGIIVYNNVAGKIKMNLGEIEEPIPAISVSFEAGVALYKGAQHRGDGNDLLGTIKLSDGFSAGPFMSDFSSWGPTPDLKLKPEITAHGGEITSTVAGGYDEYSGTSMAAPNMAGFAAILREYVREKFASELTGTDVEINRAVTRITNQLMMSTATTALDEDGLPYSPRKQGAGLASLIDSVTTGALLATDSEENDYRPKLEFGEGERDPEDGLLTYTGKFTVRNFSEAALTFTPEVVLMTESLSIDGLAVAEQAYLLEGKNTLYAGGTEINGSLTVAAGQTVEITAVIKLTAEDEAYITSTFENGMFAEGFIKLLSKDGNAAGQCDLVVPFLGFCGDWESAPMLDYTVFELSAFEQDSSIDEDEKPQAQVWATQAFSSYYNNQYILPMGTYLYDLDEFDDPMYANEEYCSVSRYNTYVSASGEGNYMTSTRLHAVYAGLLRNAREVSYTLTDATTGELILSDTMYDVGKAMTRGGSPLPANVELKLVPDEYGLVANGKYTMSFAFRMNYDDGTEVPEENTFTFSFYVDYEAPILEDVRVRYYDYTDGNKQKQRIYLDFDVYDNRYPQSLMLCYLEGNELKLVTDYITPVRNANKNGTTTVSIEVTDIYDRYDGELYVQVDDYALNYNVYKINTAQAQASVLPDTFEVVGSKDITLGVYESAKIELAYDGKANPSNFTWNYDKTVISVKNGTVVGIAPGETTLRISNGKKTERVKITVAESDVVLSKPALSFGIVKNSADGLQKAEGFVEVNPGDSFKLQLIPDPWYYPMDELEIEWTTSKESVVSVSGTGEVKALKKGTAIINAIIKGTSYSTGVTIRVRDEFYVSNFTLTKYEGVGGRVVIPTDMNIMYIGEEAFENNADITEVIIPKSVIEIHERAFIGCTSLKAVYFIEDGAMPVADADLTLVSHSAFEGCTALELFDMSNLKTVTFGVGAFKGCTSLKRFGTVSASGKDGLTNAGTIHDMAFAGCTSLESADISGLHVAGSYVFTGCTALRSVTTGRYTAIGGGMFSSCKAQYYQFNQSTGGTDVITESFAACTGLKQITLRTPNIGEGAFSGCSQLSSVTFENPTDKNGGEIAVEFAIGQRAFEGTALTAVSFGGVTVREIGSWAFSATGLKSFEMPKGLVSVGSHLFAETPIESVILSDEYDISKIYSDQSPFAGTTIKAFNAPAGSTKYSSFGGVLFSLDGSELLLFPVGKADGITATVERIADNAFHGVKAVTQIRVNGATEIVFADGQAVTLSGGEIGNWAFSGCTELKRADISALTSIGEGCFMNSGLIEVSEYAQPYIPAYAFANTFITVANIAGNRVIGDYAFANTSVKSLDSAAVEEIGRGAFSNCDMLKTVVMRGVRSVGGRAFEGCGLLESVALGAVTEMGEGIFVNSPSLKSFALGSGATVIGRAAFALNEWTMAERWALTSVELPATVTKIGDYAFYGCTGIAEIGALPTAIGYAAFCGASKLQSIDLSAAEVIGDYAFAQAGITAAELGSAREIGECAFMASRLAKLELPDGEHAVNIGDYAFAQTDLTKTIITQCVNEIGTGAFAYNAKLTAFEASGSRYFAEGGVLYGILTEDGRCELVAYPSALSQQNGEFALPEGLGVVSIHGGAFEGLGGTLKTVILPYTVRAIGHRAFYDSGIEVYEFRSMQAPELFYLHSAEGEVNYQSNMVTYTGQFTANFEKLIVEYYGKASGLTLKHPENASGYGNFVYKTFFSNRVTTGVHMDDYTREAKAVIDGLYSAEDIRGWLELEPSEENRKTVTEFATRLTLARSYFENVTDPAQQAFLTEGSGEKLSALETLMRDIKRGVGIPVTVTRLGYESDYVKDYVAGDTFNVAQSGLKLTVLYDDGSSALYEGEITLIDTAPLTVYNRFVRVSGRVDGRDYTVNVAITVTEAEQEPTPPGGDSGTDSTDSTDSTESSASSSVGTSDSEGEGSNAGTIAAIAGGGAAVIAAAAAVTVALRKKKNK